MYYAAFLFFEVIAVVVDRYFLKDDVKLYLCSKQIKYIILAEFCGERIGICYNGTLLTTLCPI